MTPRELAAELRSRINPEYAAQIGTESYERRLCAEALEAQSDEIERLMQLTPIEFGMSGPRMFFKIGNQRFDLAYDPEEQAEFDFMAKMITGAIARAAKPGWTATHLKTGNEYLVTGERLNTSHFPVPPGALMVDYERDGQKFCREAGEFQDKFAAKGNT